ncbi:hypothetical protein DFH07DRAFT_954607 [Mycena maculata]|uniref:RING-type domain-containing protein n=1 Tax=Mycena maculata TaxID=230809 RepID=A0AAD7JSR8_9AGAR|nr:hypothetical protein DFH07DRAFT_954607 [Mycena maculata]
MISFTSLVPASSRRLAKDEEYIAVQEPEQPEEDALEGPAPEPEPQQANDLFQDLRDRLQCSVCLGFLRQPYVNSCGHVFDLICLFRWFVNAPPMEMDEHLDPLGDPDYIWHRSKTCPYCRAVITTPPAPLFLVDRLLEIIGDEEDDLSTPIVAITPNLWHGVFSQYRPKQAPETATEPEADPEGQGPLEPVEP